LGFFENDIKTRLPTSPRLRWSRIASLPQTLFLYIEILFPIIPIIKELEMDIALIIIGLIFSIFGILGCLLPIIPGPPLSYIGLLLLHAAPKYQFSSKFLIIMAIIALAVTVLDNFMPAWSAKRSGGSKRAVWGAMLGLGAGMLIFPPWGLLIGPFLGAVIGELSTGKGSSEALKSGLSTFIGFLGGVVIKLMASGVMFWYFIKTVFFA